MEKKLTKEEIKYYKMTEKKFFLKMFYDYDKNSLNTKSNKNIFVKNTIMTNIIKIVKVKKRDVRSTGEFRRKLFIQDHEIYESIEHKVKSKIGKIFVNEKILEEYSVKIHEIDPYFSEHYKKKNTS